MKVEIGPYVGKGARKKKIKIHKYDAWDLDNTLSVIIYPLLKEYKKQMKDSPGVGWTDLEDFPEELRDTDDIDPNAPQITGHSSKRWNYLIDELIWTFKHLADDVWDDREETEKRIKNGLYLFGKYYRSLWN